MAFSTLSRQALDLAMRLASASSQYCTKKEFKYGSALTIGRRAA